MKPPILRIMEVRFSYWGDTNEDLNIMSYGSTNHGVMISPSDNIKRNRKAESGTMRRRGSMAQYSTSIDE